MLSYYLAALAASLLTGALAPVIAEDGAIMASDAETEGAEAAGAGETSGSTGAGAGIGAEIGAEAGTGASSFLLQASKANVLMAAAKMRDLFILVILEGVELEKQNF